MTAVQRQQRAWPVTITIVALIAVAAIGGVLYPLWRDRYQPEWTGSREDVIAALTGQCMEYLARQTGMKDNNTDAQIRGACTCVSEQLYERTSTMSKVERQAFTDRDVIREHMATAVKACLQRTGLSVAD